MNRTSIPTQLSNITQAIVREFKPDRIILFGSWAWGKPTEGSDVDLFIIKDSKQARVEREKSVYRIIFNIPIPVDVLVFTPAEVKRRLSYEDPFVTQILTRGRVLYAQ